MDLGLTGKLTAIQTDRIVSNWADQEFGGENRWRERYKEHPWDDPALPTR